MPAARFRLQDRLERQRPRRRTTRQHATRNRRHAADRALRVSPFASLQLRKLRALLDGVRATNPFYSRKLSGVAPASAVKSLDEFARLIPFTARQELVRDQQDHPPYGTDLTFPLERYIRCHQTSGSTTAPLRWLDTAETWSHIVDNWLEILAAAGVGRQDRFFFAFSFGPFLGFWSALEAAARLGCFMVPGGALSSLARLQAILDNRITVLCCTPTYAQHLGEVARRQKLDLTASRVRLIIVAGEAGGSIPATRTRIEDLWPGAMVFDHHGMTEVGPVTYQCPAGPGVLHVLESSYLAEVVHPATGAAVRPGETGELILTTLDRVGSPLIRYRTGDLVQARPRGRCACGRSELALEGGILGRADDMVVIRGVNVFPSLIEEIVRSFPEVAEYRVLLDSGRTLREVVLEIETAREFPNRCALRRRLQQSLATALSLRIPVRLVSSGSLPRFEMKARRWTRNP